jgi:uncharacterized membrane protein YeaQ/YmgE (transglycosylase-associated protein family)
MSFDISNPDTQALVLFLLIGLVAGWLAGKILGGGGLIRNLIVGVLGAFVGGYVVKALGINIGLGSAILNQVAVATIGAIVVVILAKLLR